MKASDNVKWLPKTRSEAGSRWAVFMNIRAVSRRRGWARRSAATAIGAMTVLLGGALAPIPAQASAPKTLYVSQGGLNSGTCKRTSPCATVTYALTKAASHAIIEVSGTIDDHLSISSPVTITTWPGGPADSPAVLDGTGSKIVVSVEGSGVNLDDLTVENGALGIYNDGSVTLSDSTVSGNANEGEPYAGIWNYYDGTMTVVDSTIAKNSGSGHLGSGIYNIGAMTVIASTISGNSGGGIYSGQGDTVSLGATIVADNKGGNCDAYDDASLFSAGYNLTNDKNGTACGFTAATDSVDKNPLLGPLTDNGGPTRTMLPGTKSPADDVIPQASALRGVVVCPGADQRGNARPGRGESRCTIGAAEAGFAIRTTTSVTVSPRKVKAGINVVYLAVVTPHSGTGTPTGTISFTIGSTVLCMAVLSGGVAACGATTAPIGTDTVTGRYAGGGGNAKSSSTAILTVTKA